MTEHEDSAPSPQATREIVQARDLTLREATTLTKLVTRKHVRGLNRDLWFLGARIAHCGALGVLVASAVILSDRFRCCSPEVFRYVMIAAALYIGGALVCRMRYMRGFALLNKSAYPAGTRHFIEANGYGVERNGQRSFIPWRCIVEIDRQPGLFLIATSPAHFWPTATTAIADQDVDGFCTELERRWKQARAGEEAQANV